MWLKLVLSDILQNWVLVEETLDYILSINLKRRRGVEESGRGKEGRREGGREERREGEGQREGGGGTEGGREGGREGQRNVEVKDIKSTYMYNWLHLYLQVSCDFRPHPPGRLAP